MSSDALPQDLAGQYVTEAVESVVLDADRDVIGHVGLLDVDESSRREALDAAELLPGPVAVLRSSRRSWHLWALRVAPLDAWVARADRLDVVDDDHTALAPGRGCSVLRVDHKVDVATGDEVVPAPTLLDVVDADDRPAGRVSAPHLDVLDDVVDDDLDVEGDRVGVSTDRRVHLGDVGGRE
jgi:hypothetical protein